MLHTLKHASVLAAVPAALALAIAAPASADDVDSVGTAYQLSNFGEPHQDLKSEQECTQFTDIPVATSAINFAYSGSDVTLFADPECKLQVANLPKYSSPRVWSLDNGLAAVAYSSS